MNLRRAFLWSVLGSLVLAAGMGMSALLFDVRSDRWILSMLSIALFSLLALGAAAAVEKRVWAAPMRVTIVLCVFGAVLFTCAIWQTDRLYRLPTLGKVMGLTATWAAAMTAAGLLAITRFEGLLAAVRLAALSLVFVMAAIISVTIVAEPNDNFWFRFMGATMIATGLGIVGLPILHRVKGIKDPRTIETARTEMSVTCPRCLLAQAIQAGECRCARCRLKFKLEIEEPRCPQCDYLLYRLTSPRCPECGHALAPEDVDTTAVT